MALAIMALISVRRAGAPWRGLGLAMLGILYAPFALVSGELIGILTSALIAGIVAYHKSTLLRCQADQPTVKFVNRVCWDGWILALIYLGVIMWLHF